MWSSSSASAPPAPRIPTDWRLLLPFPLHVDRVNMGGREICGLTREEAQASEVHESEANRFMGYVMQEACLTKIAIGGTMGLALGFGMGVFLAATGDFGARPMIQGKEVPYGAVNEEMRKAWRDTGKRSTSLAKNFAVFSGVWQGYECLVEKARGTHDSWNALFGGCLTGATMAAKQGLGSMCIGCLGFAAFSMVIEKVMGHDD